MFCPGCGTEDQQRSQFCRACGADLRPSRSGLEKADTLDSPEAGARAEIGRALAVKIRELQKTKDLEVLVENILPEVEKFLESPEEKRLRRIRAGVITSAIGAATMAFVFLIAFFLREKEMLAFMSIGLVAFLIGIGVMINGFLFSLPRKRLGVHSQSALEKLLEQVPASPRAAIQPPPQAVSPTVTEHTTHHLADEAAAARRIARD